jgi:hypothetical protein
MAGNGPPPKKDARRRNRKPATELDGAPADDSIPPLPRRYKRAHWDKEQGVYVTHDVAFLQSTRRWYAAWARSPLASEMTEVHWLRLQEIAQIKDRWDRTGDLDLAKELRLQLAAFGGTPADMRRMNVSLPKTPKPKPAAVTPAAAAAADDPGTNVRRLRPDARTA